MPEAPRNRKLLRIAWGIPTVLLLCAFQFGWLEGLGDVSGGAAGGADAAASPLLVSFGRRNLSSGGSDADGYTPAADVDGSGPGQPPRCNVQPSAVPKACACDVQGATAAHC